MPGIRVTEFRGVTPRYESRRSPVGTAAVARDVDLSRGSVDPWRTPRSIKSVPGAKAFYLLNDCTLLTDTCERTWWSDAAPDCGFTIKSGGGLPPRWASDDEAAAGTWNRLGLPTPDIAPLIIGGSPLTATSQGRVYVVAYEDPYGNVGAGSFPSTSIAADSGTSITCGIPQPPAGWNVAAVRLYRSVRPFVSEDIDVKVEGAEVAHKKGLMAHLALVVRLPVGLAAYIDTVPDGDLGETFVSDEHRPPPADLQQVLVMESGAAVGFRGNEIWFSDPFTHHGWPEKHRVYLDDKVVAIATMRDTVYVATDGHPYAIRDLQKGSVDEVNSNNWKSLHSGNRAVWRCDLPYPCIAWASMVAYREGAMFASKFGLLQMQGGKVGVASAGWLSEDDWKRYRPHTGRAAAWGTRYVFATDTETLLFDLGKEDVAAEERTLSMLSMQPVCLHGTRRARLLYLDGGVVRGFNEGEDYLNYFWRHDEVTFPALMCLAAAKVVAEFAVGISYERPIHVSHYAYDGAEIMAADIENSRPYRVPRTRSLNAAFAVAGIVRVTEVHVATSMQDLGNAS